MTSWRAIDLARAAGKPRQYGDQPDCCVFATEFKKFHRGRGIIRNDRLVRLYSDLALLSTLMEPARGEAKCGAPSLAWKVKRGGMDNYRKSRDTLISAPPLLRATRSYALDRVDRRRGSIFQCIDMHTYIMHNAICEHLIIFCNIYWHSIACYCCGINVIGEVNYILSQHIVRIIPKPLKQRG
jgi:hypothetical protein